MSSSTQPGGEVPLASILVTEDMGRRPSRAPDYAAENRALTTLANTLSESPRDILQKLVEVAREYCDAGSAGVSLLSKDDGGKTFYWPAVTGGLSPFVGGGTPRDFGPCGVVLDHGAMQLFTHPERYFDYLIPIQPPLEEVLLTPFFVNGEAVGTVWLVAHTPMRKFDAEDLRFIRSLGTFASAAYQVLESMDAQEVQSAALRASEARLRRMLGVEKVGVLYFSLDGRIHDANPALERMTGYTAAELRAVSDWNLLTPPEFAEVTNRSASNLIEIGKTPPYEKEWIRKDGSRFFGLFTPTRVSGEGANAECVEFIFDITDRKAAEQALQEADRRKNEFLAILAHELRNPLAPIRTAAEVMRLSDPTPTFEHLAEVIVRQAAQMARLIDDLLDVSRINRGTIELRREALNLAAVVRQAADTARPEFAAAGVEFTVNLPDQTVSISGDPARLLQVLGNLLNNAAKFTMPDGHVRLTLTRDRDVAVIVVQDDGIGIAPTQQERVFQMFVQVDSAVERSKGGLGLGLTLVKTLVELHGGSVRVQSDGAGSGTAFILDFPIAESALAAAEDAAASAIAGPGSLCRRVLVVDDNIDSAEMLARLLTMQGHDIRIAHDGANAIGETQSFAPEVVFLDIGLPGMSGYEVAQRIRESATGRRPLLVALTGWGQETDRLRSAAAGFDVHVLKPIDPETIYKLVTQDPAPFPPR